MVTLLGRIGFIWRAGLKLHVRSSATPHPRRAAQVYMLSTQKLRRFSTNMRSEDPQHGLFPCVRLRVITRPRFDYWIFIQKRTRTALHSDGRLPRLPGVARRTSPVRPRRLGAELSQDSDLAAWDGFDADADTITLVIVTSAPNLLCDVPLPPVTRPIHHQCSGNIVNDSPIL